MYPGGPGAGLAPAASGGRWRGAATRRASLVGLCLAAAALRFITVGQQSFWLDEAATGRLVRMGLDGLLRGLPDGESTPPLYYVLAWFWTRPLGTSEVGLRSLSALVGTLTVPLIYLAGARLLDRRAGLAAAGLAAFSPLLIWYSQEARAYALLVALCAASLWALGAALEPAGGRRPLVLWTLLSVAALATHYFAVFLILPQLLWLAWARGRTAIPALAGLGLAAAALLPLALHQRAGNRAGFIAESPRATRLVQAAKQLVVGYDAPAQVLLTLAGAALVLALGWLAARGLDGPARGMALRLAGMAVAAICLPVGLALFGFDYLITRNLIGAWVPAALALAGAGVGCRGRAAPALILGLCALGLAATLGVALDPRYQRDDWRGAAGSVPRAGPTAVVLTPAAGRLPLSYYLPRSRPLPAGGAAVAWVEVIGLAARGVGAPLRAPPISSAPPRLAGFAAPVARRGPTFSVLRYRAAGPPVSVTPAELAPLALGGTPPTVLIEH